VPPADFQRAAMRVSVAMCSAVRARSCESISAGIVAHLPAHELEFLVEQLGVEREAADRQQQEHERRHDEATFTDHLLDVLGSPHREHDQQQREEGREQQSTDEDVERVGRALRQLERRRALPDEQPLVLHDLHGAALDERGCFEPVGLLV
jgi:hypothetical protein